MVTIIPGGPGLHHQFLRFTLDYVCRDTPTIKNFPFDHTGASHLENINYSNTFNIQKNLPTKEGNYISIEADDILYYERIALARESSANKDLVRDVHDFNNWHNWNTHTIEKIYKFYKIDNDKKIPNFILRDFFKLGHMDSENHGLKKQNKEVIDSVKKHNSIILPVSSFFNLSDYKTQLEKIEKHFSLSFDYENLPNLYQKFHDSNKILTSHKIVYEVLDAVRQNIKIEIPALDIWQEAFIFSELEKNNDFILMPMINKFYTNTAEISEYLNNYPEHYKAMNPNLPKFNGMDNPFFLHRQKAK